jgi:hypothetical protein
LEAKQLFSRVEQIPAHHCPELFGVSFGEADYGVHLPIVGAARKCQPLGVRHFAKKQFHTRQRLSFDKTASLKGKLDA